MDHALHSLSVFTKSSQNLLRLDLVGIEEGPEACEFKDAKFRCDTGNYEEVEYGFGVSIENSE
jgi:hypothetical protein